MPILAIPLLVAVLLAVMAVLIILALKPLSTLIKVVFAQVPLIGSWVGDHLSAAAESGVALLTGFLDAYVAPLARVLTYPIYVLQRLFDAITGALHAIAGTLAHVIKVTLPWMLGVLRADIRIAVDRLDAATHALIGSVKAFLLGEIAAAVAMVRADLEIVRVRLGHAIDVLRADTTAAVRAVERDIASTVTLARTLAAGALAAATALAWRLYHDAVAYVDATAASLRALIGAGVAQAEATAARLAADAEAAAIKAVDVEAAAVAAVAWPVITDEINALEGILATDLPDIGAAVRAIPRDIPGDLAATLAGVGALSIPMIRFLRECGVPNCRNLGSLGRDLQALLGLVEDVAFIGLITELITDPSGAARDIESTLGALATDTINGARTVLGV